MQCQRAISIICTYLLHDIGHYVILYVEMVMYTVITERFKTFAYTKPSDIRK